MHLNTCDKLTLDTSIQPLDLSLNQNGLHSAPVQVTVKIKNTHTV